MAIYRLNMREFLNLLCAHVGTWYDWLNSTVQFQMAATELVRLDIRVVIVESMNLRLLKNSLYCHWGSCDTNSTQERMCLYETKRFHVV